MTELQWDRTVMHPELLVCFCFCAESFHSGFNSGADEDSLCTSQSCQVHGDRQSGLHRYAVTTYYVFTTALTLQTKRYLKYCT